MLAAHPDAVVRDLTLLANPAHSALTGRQAHLGLRRGRAARFRPDVSPFAGLPADAGAQDWADLAALVEPGETVILVGPRRVLPDGWLVQPVFDGVQMNGAALAVERDPEAVELGDEDVPEMLDLVRRTNPGPFLTHTIDIGRYLGIHRDGRLVAMAGERMHVAGATEISAVCTDPALRGHGLASRLVKAVGFGIRERGEVPFLHVSATNTGAIRLYESLGFVHAREMVFQPLQRG